jgi:hypothetical protein
MVSHELLSSAPIAPASSQVCIGIKSCIVQMAYSNLAIDAGLKQLS